MAFRRVTSLRSLLKPISQIEAFVLSPLASSHSLAITSTMETQFRYNIAPLYKHFSGIGTEKGEEVKRRDKESTGKKALMIDEDEYDSVTDKVPEKVMTAAEGISYTLVILAAFAVLIACLTAFVYNYLLETTEYTCFNITLEKLRTDPRVTVRIGSSIKGYGSDSMNRRQRQIIRNRQYKDVNGTEHMQIQFNISGSEGAGIVYADMFQDDSKKWQYTYLYVDVPERGRNTLQRLAIITPTI